MARITNITFAQVAQIADGMKAAGHRPTARALRERIGSGSMGTIHKLLQQYNGNQSEDREAAELPESIATALMDFIQTEIATACEPYQQTEQEIKEAVGAMAEENERLENVIGRLKRERDEAEHPKTEVTGQLVALRREYAEIKVDIDALKEIKSNQLREIDRLERNAEADRTALAELSQLRRANETLGVQYANVSTERAVLSAQLDATTENAKDLKERLTVSETNAKNHYTEAKTANQHYQACAARLEEAARTIDELKKKAQPTPKVAKPKLPKPAPIKAEA